MTNDELYLSFLEENNNAKSRQAEVTKRLKAEPKDLEEIATRLKLKGADLSSMKRQIERASKALNLPKLTLHKNKKNEPCTIGEPKKQGGGKKKKSIWDKFLEEFVTSESEVRTEVLKQLTNIDNNLRATEKKAA